MNATEIRTKTVESFVSNINVIANIANHGAPCIKEFDIVEFMKNQEGYWDNLYELDSADILKEINSKLDNVTIEEAKAICNKHWN